MRCLPRLPRREDSRAVRAGRRGGRHRELSSNAAAGAGARAVTTCACWREPSAIAKAYGVPCERIAWSDEHDAPSPEASSRVAVFARTFEPDVSVAHNVLDAGVLAAARTNTPRFVYHLHDHRPFCPNGDRVYPRDGTICTCRWALRRAGCTHLRTGARTGRVRERSG